MTSARKAYGTTISYTDSRNATHTERIVINFKVK